MGDLSANSEPVLTREQARAWALEAGFQEAGLVALPYAAETRDAERFREWVAAGRAGTMGYLKRKSEDGQLLRERAEIPFPWARSALVCFASYTFPSEPLSTKTAERGSAWIARYAWTSRVLPSRVLVGRGDPKGERRPSDYHKVLLKRIRAVEARLHEQLGEFESRAYVDTGPIVERALATAAGLGWTGKNTCLIHQRLGSFGFLAVLLTSLDVSEGAREQATPASNDRSPGAPAGSVAAGQWPGLQVADRCGSCTRCIEACPTDALDVPYQMDASRCISYLTIEHKGPIAEEFAAKHGQAGFRLRHLPGCVPLESEVAGKSAAQRSDGRRRRTRAAPGAGQSRTGVVGFARRAVLRTPIQRIAGASRGISRPQAQRRHRHGQQRTGSVRAAA